MITFYGFNQLYCMVNGVFMIDQGDIECAE